MRSRTRHFFVNFGLAFLVFTVIAVFFSSESYFFYLLKGMQPDFWKDFGWKMVRWIPWAFFTPGIVRFVRWFPFDRERWYISLPVHITLSVILSFIQSSFFYFYSQIYDLTWHVSLGVLVEYFIKFFHLNFLTYLVTLGVCYLLDYYRKHREHELKTSRLQAQLTQAQLEVLKMQLHPHFLFNTLHAISALVHQDADTAEKMISRMSSLLRLSLESSGLQEVTLKKELESLKLYLEIEKMRFGDRLDVRVDVSPETLDALVPSFLLLPLVENVIRMKIAPRESGGRIRLDVSRQGARLVVLMDDNGNGWKLDRDSAEQKEMILKTTRERISQLYGANHRFTLGEEGAQAEFIRMELPFREAPQQKS